MQSDAKIKVIAESLLENFLPKDAEATTLSFCFTVPPSESYEVHFKKIGKNWEFLGGERQFPTV